MYELIQRLTLRLLKAPAEPHAPIGDPASLRVFRAGQNYYRLRVVRWAIVETLALGGLIFWTFFLVHIGGVVAEKKEARAAQISGSSASRAEGKGEMQRGRKRRYKNWWEGFSQSSADFAMKLPSGAFAVIWAIKIISALVFFFQLAVTYVALRLDYEMRWYMVTDRSLRLRYGVWKIAETTMSFANMQQVVVSQGPLQRLLGLGDVRVKSAGGGGGGGGGDHNHHHGDDMHTAIFASVTNGDEIRDLILERLRRFRESGLGDPDEKVVSQSVAEHNGAGFRNDALAAAREVAAEARALRAVITSQS